MIPGRQGSVGGERQGRGKALTCAHPLRASAWPALAWEGPATCTGGMPWRRPAMAAARRCGSGVVRHERGAGHGEAEVQQRWRQSFARWRAQEGVQPRVAAAWPQPVRAATGADRWLRESRRGKGKGEGESEWREQGEYSVYMHKGARWQASVAQRSHAACGAEVGRPRPSSRIVQKRLKKQLNELSNTTAKVRLKLRLSRPITPDPVVL